MALSFTTTFSGSASEADQRAIVHAIDAENARRAVNRSES